MPMPLCLCLTQPGCPIGRRVKTPHARKSFCVQKIVRCVTESQKVEIFRLTAFRSHYKMAAKPLKVALAIDESG